jgi:integrase
VPWSEKLPSGRYRASYRDAHGKARSAGTFPNKKAATNAAAVAESEARKLGYKDPRAGLMLWGDWVEVWWPTRQVEPGTAARDRSRLVRLSTKWETVPLVSITRHDVKLWLSELSADGLAPATVQRHLSLFSASLRAAIDAEIIQTNPAYRIQIAKGETLEHRYLTRPEFAALVRKIPDDFDKAIVSTLVGTGMRWGEAIGLQVQRIDFDRGVIRVAEGWDDKMRRVKPYPKGRKVRDVPLAPWVAAYLEPLAGDRRTGNVWAPEGNPPDYHNWRRRVWLPALKDAKLTDVRIHDLTTDNPDLRASGRESEGANPRSSYRSDAWGRRGAIEYSYRLHAAPCRSTAIQQIEGIPGTGLHDSPTESMSVARF